MAGENQEATWPVPKFHFKITIGDKGEIAFQEVSGLDTEHDNIEYRAGNSVGFGLSSVPGLRKASDVTLKKGFFKANRALSDYFNEVKMNTVKRETVMIQLLDEEHKPMFTWTLQNAWPIKITGTDMNSQSSEVAIDELVFSYEGLTAEKA